jgi:hypothetical protein
VYFSGDIRTCYLVPYWDFFDADERYMSHWIVSHSTYEHTNYSLETEEIHNTLVGSDTAIDAHICCFEAQVLLTFFTCFRERPFLVHPLHL